MKKIFVASVCVLVFVCVLSFLPSGEELAVYDGVIRLHVLANSDSEEDQSLKLYVRDCILDGVGEIVDGAETKTEAEAAISASLDEIAELAKAAVEAYGHDDAVSVTLSEEKYPEKSYGCVILPSGTYTSLRVMIGEAEGENWWCVLFPNICTSPALAKADATGETEEKFIEAGFTPSQYRLITDSKNVRYTVKFRIVEIWNAIFG